MIDERELREMLERRAATISASPTDAPKAIRRARRRLARNAAVGTLVGLAALVGAFAGVRTIQAASRPGQDTQPAGTGTAAVPDSPSTATPIPSLQYGALEAGTYVVKTLDPDFDAKYRITMDVPDGYSGMAEGYGVAKQGRIGQMAVGAWVIGDVYADPCRWETTLLDPPPVSSVDALVAALAGQKGLRVSTPTDIRVDGFAGKSMERTVRAGINVADCDGGEFRTFLDTGGGNRYLEPGTRVMLWIIDVDGVPLVIDASLGAAGTSARDRAAHIQIAESVRIDPR
jgi:hypothetical protein